MASAMAKDTSGTDRTGRDGKGRGTDAASVAERRGGPRRIGELAPDIGRAAFRRFGFVQSSIVTRWPEIAGERYAALSQPEMIRFPRGQRAHGTLHLIVESAAATMLQHVMPEMIERVNRFFGYAAISQIRIQQGRVQRPAPATPRPPPNIRPIPVELGDSLRDIGDPELRAVLENLAAGLARSEGPPKIG